MTFGFAPLGVLSLVVVGGRAAVRGLGQAVTLWSRHRAMHRIATLDDRMLKDIGLSRSDVSGALDLPWTTDSTEFLADRRRSRRHPSTALRIVDANTQARRPPGRDWVY